ncbi:PrnB family protein [Moritella dasanensis]|uniref:PrnB family protein n=1 Tax=Moritella dasanensis TaxID=428031 RepID=UPI00031A63ED|nr:monodechloroaminopyrrolnitrin synthase PrnB family protein [Moritella dasanensis]
MKNSSNATQIFDLWIRSSFVDINTELESLYWQQEDRDNVDGVGDALKQQLESEGNALIKVLLAEGNTSQNFDNAFNLLGSVGLYMAACRRHELTEPSRETRSPLIAASALAMHLGPTIGMAPRFSTAHLTTHNIAENGIYKRFTTLHDESLFVDYNTRSILAFKRAAEALSKIHVMGISHPLCYDLLLAAKQGLSEVIDSNTILFSELDTDRFFHCVRPYYKPYRVGTQIYRGANAGDFAGINIVDMLLGLCRANEPFYSQMLVDKFTYMMPEDQQLLRDCMQRANLMDDFLSQQQYKNQAWYQRNLTVFLDVCKLHGATAIQHHDQLVNKYIAQPASQVQSQHMDKLTASGPPLHILLRSLEKLRDLRAANPREDIATRYHDMLTLHSSLN